MFLTDSQAKTGLCAVANIKDKLAAIEMELVSREKPYKPYLNEKLDSIYWDVKVLMNMSKIKTEDEENEE